MGADNWAVCPRCKETAEQKLGSLQDELPHAYGQVPAEKYLQMVAVANTPLDHKLTLREDYEIGITDGLFEVEYRASCGVCLYAFEYKFAKDAL